MKTFEGKLVSKDIKIGIVAARFNEFITSKLLGGAIDALTRHNVDEDDIEIAIDKQCQQLDAPRHEEHRLISVRHGDGAGDDPS